MTVTEKFTLGEIASKRIHSGPVSSLMLERYNLGEVTAEEKELIEYAISSDAGLASRYRAIEESNRELLRLYPWASLSGGNFHGDSPRENGTEREASRLKPAARKSFVKARVAWFCAAAVFLCFFVPALNYMRSASSAALPLQAGGGDRAKGAALEAEFSIYLKESVSALPLDDDPRLPDGTTLREGNTVQLAYTTPPGAAYYGIIFSIDGRRTLTLHYPYREGESPVLAAGKKTFLSEAYILDDAPFFEIFFMVISPDELETENVLRTARELASNPETAPENFAAAFGAYEVKTITIRKEK